MLRRRLEMIAPLSSTLVFSITVIALKGEKKSMIDIHVYIPERPRY